MAMPTLFLFALLHIFPFDVLPMVMSESLQCETTPASDADQIQFAMNLEFLEAEFFLYGAFGKGLDSVAPNLANGGPPPIGGHKANLDPLIQNVTEEFAYEEVGHIRAIIETVGGIQRPLLNISAANFARLFDEAIGRKLNPPFDPYTNSINYLLASYLIPYVGLGGYVGAIPNLVFFNTKSLVAGLLGVEAGQDAVLRAYLSVHANEMVVPYNFTVAEVTSILSSFRNKLGMCGLKDKGIIVPAELGAEGKITTNVLSANNVSISYPRTPREVLRIVYGTGYENVPGGFYPRGANGRIARSFLQN